MSVAPDSSSASSAHSFSVSVAPKKLGNLGYHTSIDAVNNMLTDYNPSLPLKDKVVVTGAQAKKIVKIMKKTEDLAVKKILFSALICSLTDADPLGGSIELQGHILVCVDLILELSKTPKNDRLKRPLNKEFEILQKKLPQDAKNSVILLKQLMEKCLIKSGAHKQGVTDACNALKHNPNTFYQKMLKGENSPEENIRDNINRVFFPSPAVTPRASWTTPPSRDFAERIYEGENESNREGSDVFESDYETMETTSFNSQLSEFGYARIKALNEQGGDDVISGLYAELISCLEIGTPTSQSAVSIKASVPVQRCVQKMGVDTVWQRLKTLDKIKQSIIENENPYMGKEDSEQTLAFLNQLAMLNCRNPEAGNSIQTICTALVKEPHQLDFFLTQARGQIGMRGAAGQLSPLNVKDVHCLAFFFAVPHTVQEVLFTCVQNLMKDKSGYLLDLETKKRKSMACHMLPYQEQACVQAFKFLGDLFALSANNTEDKEQVHVLCTDIVEQPYKLALFYAQSMLQNSFYDIDTEDLGPLIQYLK